MKKFEPSPGLNAKPVFRQSSLSHNGRGHRSTIPTAEHLQGRVAVKALFQTMVEHTATTQRNSPRHFSACSGFYNFAGLGRKGLLAKNIEQRGRRTRTKTGQWRPQFVARRLPLPAFLGRFRPWFHFGGERKAFTFRSCLKLPY